MNPVAKSRVIQLDDKRPKLTHAQRVAKWQARAKDDGDFHGRNPFNVGDEVEICTNARGFVRATVIETRGRFEHYRVLVEYETGTVHGKLRAWRKAFAHEMRLHEPRRVRALKID